MKKQDSQKYIKASTPKNMAEGFIFLAGQIRKTEKHYINNLKDEYDMRWASIDRLKQITKKEIGVDLPPLPDLPRGGYYAGLVGLSDYCIQAAAILEGQNSQNVTRIAETQTQSESGNQTALENSDNKKPLPPRIEKAYQSYCFGEKKSGLSKDRQVYDYIKENPIDEYDLPAFETWVRYVHSGRKFYSTHKNTPRTGRSVRAGNATKDPDLLKQISNLYAKPD